MEWIDSCRPAQQFVSHPITETVKGRIQKELFDMAQELGVTFTASPFTEIWAEAEFYLDLIASHLNRREIMSSAMTGSNEETEKAEFSRALRIGFFPVSADPFHWGHLLIGLSAMARFTLDKVIYVLSGSDERKPGMTPPGIRHPMGRSILNLFTPLFDYSSAALESDLDWLHVKPKESTHSISPEQIMAAGSIPTRVSRILFKRLRSMCGVRCMDLTARNTASP
jgi:hypothetical protein